MKIPGKLVGRIQSQIFNASALIAGSFFCSTGLIKPDRAWLILNFQGEVSIGNPDLVNTGVFVVPPGVPVPFYPNGSNSTPILRPLGGVFQVSSGGVGSGGRANFSPGGMGAGSSPTGETILPFWLHEGWQLLFSVAGSPANMLAGVAAALTVMYIDVSVDELCKL